MEIKRKDGITYARNPKEKNFPSFLHVRIACDKYEELKKIAKEKNTTPSNIVRNLVDEYLYRK